MGTPLDVIWGYVKGLNNETDYLNAVLGPRRLSLEYLIPLILVYSIIFIVGLFGNIFLSVAILCNRSLYSPTNFYIIALSFTDITLLILGLPFDFYLLFNYYPWRFGEFVCFAKSLLSDISANTSVLIVVALTIERYLAICHPFGLTFLKDSRLLSKFTFIDLRANHYHEHPIIVICVSLCFGIFLGYFLSLGYKIEVVKIGNVTIADSSICTAYNDDSVQAQTLIFLSFFISFIIPVLILTILYLRIIFKIKKSLREVNKFREYNSSENKSNSQKKNPAKILSNKLLNEKPNSSSNNQDFHSPTSCNSNEINENNDPNKTISTSDHHKKMHTINLKRTIRVPIWVVISFFACFGPFHICRLLHFYRSTPNDEKHRNVILYHISGLCLHSISVANPILYNLLSKRFQRVFFSIFKRKRSKGIDKSFHQRTFTLKMYSYNNNPGYDSTQSRNGTLKKPRKNKPSELVD